MEISTKLHALANSPSKEGPLTTTGQQADAPQT